MKKLVTLVLAVALVLAMATTAFAATVPTSEEQAVSATINHGEANTTNKVYSVNIAWTDVAFSYNAGGYDWNTETLAYDIPVAGSWNDTTGTVTVSNRSNADVVATIEFDTAEGVAATIKVDEVETDEMTLTAATSGETSNTFDIAVAVTAEVDLTADSFALGTITVSIAAAAQ